MSHNVTEKAHKHTGMMRFIKNYKTRVVPSVFHLLFSLVNQSKGRKFLNLVPSVTFCFINIWFVHNQITGLYNKIVHSIKSGKY